MGMDVNEAMMEGGNSPSLDTQEMATGPVTADSGQPPIAAANDSRLPMTAGYYNAPADIQGFPAPDLPTSFDNPYRPIPNLDLVRSKEFDLDQAMNSLANKKPSFQAATAPIFFDWDKTQADRYVNSDYFQEKGFVPGRDNETLYGHRQTFGDTMENAFAGMGSLAWNSFKGGWAGWGNLVNALFNWGSDSSFKERLMGTGEELAESNREQTDIFNKYAIFSTPESENSVFNRQFLGNMIQQGGFAVGTLVQTVMEELLTRGAAKYLRPLTGIRSAAQLAQLSLEQAEMAKDMVSLGSGSWKSMATVKNLYEGLKTGVSKVGELLPGSHDLFSLGSDIAKAREVGAKGLELAGVTLNGFRRTLAEANMAFTESRMEAAGTYADLRQQLYDKTLHYKGSVSYEDEQRIEDQSQKAAWGNFLTNAVVLSAMNRLQYDNIIKTFGSSKRMFRFLEEAGDDVVKVTGTAARDITVASKYGDVLVKEGEKATQVYDKKLFGNFKEVAADFGKRTAAWEAVKNTARNMMKWEVSEGFQELMQEGSNQAMKDYYADLYDDDHASWGKSINKGIESQLNTQGMKTFLMGAMTGRLISPFSRGLERGLEAALTTKDERQAAEASRADAMGVLNAFFADPSRFAPEQVANIKIQNRAAEKMQAAMTERDKYMYKNAQDAAFAKAVFAAKKLDMMDALQDSFRQYGKHFNKQQLYEAFGQEINEENGGSVENYMNDIADRAVKLSKRYDEWREKLGDYIRPEQYNKKDREGAEIAKRAVDDMAEWIAFDEHRATRAAERVNEIMQKASKIPALAKSAYQVFRVLGDDETLDGEITLLSKELSEEIIAGKAAATASSTKATSKAVNPTEAADTPQQPPSTDTAAPGATTAPPGATTAPSHTTPTPVVLPSQLAPTDTVSSTPRQNERPGKTASSMETEETQRMLSQKEEELQALLAFKATKHLVIRDENAAPLTPQEQKDREEAVQALSAYANLINKKSGIQTVLNGTDLEDAFISLRDMRTLGKDERDFMDLYALKANPKKTKDFYIRIREGLEYVKMLKMRAEKEGDANQADIGQPATAATANPGDTVGSYHGYKVGDKVQATINNVKSRYSIERISTTQVELLNNDTGRREQLSLDHFDELVAHKEIELQTRVEHLNQMLPSGTKMIDSKRGVFLAKLSQNAGFVLMDRVNNILEEGGKDRFDDENEARDARDRLIELHKQQEATDNAPFTFDGKELHQGDVLIASDGKRYRVASKEATSSELQAAREEEQKELANTVFTRKDLEQDKEGKPFTSSGTAVAAAGSAVTDETYVKSFLDEGDEIKFFSEKWRTGVVNKNKQIVDASGNPWGIIGILAGKDGQIINETKQKAINASYAQQASSSKPGANSSKLAIEIAPLEGGQHTSINSLQGYERAVETAARRRQQKAHRQPIKFRNVRIPTLVQAQRKQGQTQEEADRELEALILRVNYKDFVGNLTIHISAQKPTSGSARAGEADENPRLEESTGPYLVELLYNGKLIGTLNYFDQYRYKKADGSLEEMNSLTVDQFKEIFDTGNQDARALLEAFKTQWNTGNSLFRELLSQKTMGKTMMHEGKEVTVIKSDMITRLMSVHLSTDTYDYVQQPATALKDLNHTGVNGKTVVIARTATGTPQVHIEGGLTQQQEDAIRKNIEQNKKKLEAIPGTYIAVVELPNKELRFVPLLAPTYEVQELDTLAQAITAQSQKTVQDNVSTNNQGGKVIKDAAFNKAFTNDVLGRVVFSITSGTANYAAQLRLNAAGHLLLELQHSNMATIIEVGGAENGALSFSNFGEMLAAINKGIEAHNLDTATNPLDKLSFRLRPENFRKRLDSMDFSKVREMSAFVSKNVVRDVSVLLRPKTGGAVTVVMPIVPLGVEAESIGAVGAAKTVGGDAGAAGTVGRDAASVGTVGDADTVGEDAEDDATVGGDGGTVGGDADTVGGDANSGLGQQQRDPLVEKVDELNRLKNELPDVETKVYSEYSATMSKKDALKAVRKDSRVVEMEKRIEQLEQELDKISGAYKIIGAEEWTKKWSGAEVVQINDFEAWMQARLPNFIGVVPVELIKKNLLKKGVTVGRFVYSLKSLSEKIKGTIEVDPAAPFKFHEAFHAVFRLLLSDSQISDHLNIARKEVREKLRKEGKTLQAELGKMRELAPQFYSEDISDKELEELYYEEYMADQFEAWVQDPKVKTDPRNKSFFRKLLDLIRGLFHYTTPSELETLFYDINAGTFKGNALATNRFTQAERLEIGKPVEVYKNIFLEDVIIKDKDGQVVKVKRYLPEQKSTELAAAIAAVFYNRREQAREAGKQLSKDELLEEILADYARLYDKNNEQYLRDLDHEDTREKYFKTARELDKYQKIFTEENGKTALKEAIAIHMRSIDYLMTAEEEEEDDIIQEEGNKGGMDFLKKKESYGGFGSLPKWLRQYIATTTYAKEDIYGNTELREGEPLLQAVDASQVYSGILKVVAGFQDEHKMLQRMQEFGRYNVQSGHFVRRFFADMGIEVGDKDYKVTKEGMEHKFMQVMKRFQQYTPDYLLFSRNMTNQTTSIYQSNRRDASSAQFSKWYNAYAELFESPYLQSSNKEALLENRLEPLALFESKANTNPITDEELRETSELISQELSLKLGWNLHPTFIQYSLVCARLAKDLTPAQSQLVSTFSEVESLKGPDVKALMEVIRSGYNPFSSGKDMQRVQETGEQTEEDSEKETYESHKHLMKMAYANSIFDETVTTTSFRNAEGELVYAHQLPTYHLVKVRELAQLLAPGVEPTEALNQLLSNPFLANHFLLQQEQFRQMAGNLNISRIEGISADYGNGRKGVTYGKFTEREMMVALFELYGALKEYKGADGRKFFTTQHLIRVLEASSTGDTVNLPAFAAVDMDIFDGFGLTQQAMDMLAGEVRREFERIGRVKQEIAQIEEERMAYEEKGTPRKTKEIQGFHNTQGAKEPSKAVPRGLQLFRTGMLLGALAEKLEKEAQLDNPNFKQYETEIKNALQHSLIGSEKDMEAFLKQPETTKPKSLLQRTLKAMIKNDIIKVDKNGTLQNVLLPSFMAEGLKNRYGKVEEDKNEALNLKGNNLLHNIAQVTMNDYINTFSFNQLLLGDQAQSLTDYVDMVKRAKGANGSGSSIYSDILAPSLGITHPNTHSHILQFADPMYAGKYAGKRVRKADGQMWITLKSFRYTLFGLGKLTPRIAGLLDQLERGEPVKIDEVFGDEGSISYDGQTNSLKMVYYDDGRYIKISAFLLTPELTSVKNEHNDWVAREGYEELHQLRTKLEDYETRHKTITMAVPESSSKNEKANVATGILPVQRQVGEETIEVDPITDWNFQKLDNKYWRLQIENRTNKIIITDPTQAKQIVLHEQDNDLKVQFDWGVDGAPVNTEMTVGQLKKLYLQAGAQRVRLKYWHARGEIFDLQGSLDEVTKSIKEGKVTPKLAAFQQRALETLRQTGADSQLLEFFSLGEDGKPKYNLNHPVTLEKFTQLFLAHFSKGVLNEKIPGHALTLVSSYGVRVLKEVLAVDENGQPKRWRVIRRRLYEQDPTRYRGALRWANEEERTFEGLAETLDANKKAGKPTYILDDLRHDVPEYGVDKNGHEIIVGYYTEYMTAPHSAEAMELALGDDDIPDVLARAFGVRIPSQAKHSTVNLRLVDFLPAHYGSSGMFAPELTQISGADHDLDMLYTSFKEYYTRRKNGKLEFIEYGRAKNIKDQYKEYLHYEKRKNKEFRQRYKELLMQDKAYQLWKDEVKETKKLFESLDEAFNRTRASTASKIEAFHTRRSIDALFDVIFGGTTDEGAEEIDFDELMQAIEKDTFLDELKALPDKHSRIQVLRGKLKELTKSLRAADDRITSQVLQEFKLPTTEVQYQHKLKNEGEQHLGKLNNQVLDSKIRLVGNEHMRSTTDKSGKTVTPIAYEVASIDPLEAVLKYLKDTFPNLKDQLEEGSEDVDSILGKVIAFRNNKEGAVNIGPAVDAILAYTLLNEFNVSIRTERMDWKGKKKVSLWHFRLNGVPFTSYGHTRSLSKDANGNWTFEGKNRIMNDLSALVTAMTDNAKERLAAKLGLNIEAVGMVSNMVAQGVPLQSAIMFILQPVVQQYYAKTRNLKSGLKTAEEENESVYAVEQQMQRDLEKQSGKKADETVELTDELLKENILAATKNPQHELAVLRSFLKLKEQTKFFGKVAGVMKLTKGLGTSFDDIDAMDEKINDLMLHASDEAFNKSYVPFDVRQVMTGRNKQEDHHNGMAACIDVFNETKKLAEPVFIERTRGYKRSLEIATANAHVRKFETKKFNKQFKHSFIGGLSLVLYKKMLEDKSRPERLISLHQGMVHDADAVKMPEGFLDIVGTVLEIRERLPDNYFVQQFLSALPTTIPNGSKGMQSNPHNTTGINKAEVDTWAKLNQLQTEKLQDSFLEIYQNYEGRKGKDGTHDLAWALFHYLLVKDGGLFKSGTFIRYVPNTMFKDLLNSTAQVNEALHAGLESPKFKSVFGVDGNTFMQEFLGNYLLNVNNQNYIREVNLSEFDELLKVDGGDAGDVGGDVEEVGTVGGDAGAVGGDAGTVGGDANSERQRRRRAKVVSVSEDGAVLQINLLAGVKEKQEKQGAKKLSDAEKENQEQHTKYTDEENARKKNNWDELNKRGFKKQSVVVQPKKGNAISFNVLRFPLVIKSFVERNGVPVRVFYKLTAVNGKNLDTAIPLKGLGKDKVALGGEQATYVMIEGLEGSAQQWAASFVLGKPDLRPILRQRGPVLNQGGNDLDAPAAKTYGFTPKAASRTGNGSLNTAHAFMEAHGVDVFFDQSKGGWYFMKDGRMMEDQEQMRKLYTQFGERLAAEAVRRNSQEDAIDSLYSGTLWSDDEGADMGEVVDDGGSEGDVDPFNSSTPPAEEADEAYAQQQQAEMDALFEQMMKGPIDGC
jgi:hypothetical protein